MAPASASSPPNKPIAPPSPPIPHPHPLNPHKKTNHMKTHSDHELQRLEAVGNGSYLYRWDIHSELQEQPSEDGEGVTTRTVWVAEEVTVWMPLTPNRITAAVITEAFPADYEQKLLNEYNAANLGMIPDREETEKRLQAYTDFLRRRAELKKEIDAFCAEHGIR